MTPGVRIASVSGSAADRPHGLAEVAAHEDVHYIVGDWLSEYNMASRGAAKASSGGAAEPSEFEASFLDALDPALPHLAARGIRVVANAGASDTEGLYRAVVERVRAAGLDLRVAWVGGDEVLEQVQEAVRNGEDFTNLTTGQKLSAWGFEPVYAQCYLGGWGIAEALARGADVVLCGRVADASPTVACAAHHHGWGRGAVKELAGALVAGHLVECSTYVTGGNFSGFKALPGTSVDLGFPVVEVREDGSFAVSKQRGKGGVVTVDTCRAQLLYEIQGPLYYNSDVVARLDGVRMEQTGEDVVTVTNITGLPPPPTTKVGITARGGFQAEGHYFLCGLDIDEKAALLERQLRAALDGPHLQRLDFRVTGRCAPDPRSQDAATADLRIFAQARDAAALAPARFLKPINDNIMQGYPGATFALDMRQGLPRPFLEYFVATLPQARVRHACHLPWRGEVVEIAAPAETEAFRAEQESYETGAPVVLEALGRAERAPLGHVVHARSGDKGSDCNVGFFVRHEDEWDWLRSFLTVDRVRELLGDDDGGRPIHRFELPNISAVHFLLKDHLDRGVTATSSYDVLGKNVAEYLRCKLVDIPVRFLERGRI